MIYVEVITQGSIVIIDSDIEGMVTAVTLRDKNILYEVTWWDGRTRKSEWFSSMEVKEKVETIKTKVGFE